MPNLLIQKLDSRKKEILAIGFALSYLIPERERGSFLQALVTYLKLPAIKGFEISFDNEATIRKLLVDFSFARIFSHLDTPKNFLTNFATKIKNKKYEEILDDFFDEPYDSLNSVKNNDIIYILSWAIDFKENNNEFKKSIDSIGSILKNDFFQKLLLEQYNFLVSLNHDDLDKIKDTKKLSNDFFKVAIFILRFLMFSISFYLFLNFFRFVGLQRENCFLLASLSAMLFLYKAYRYTNPVYYFSDIINSNCRDLLTGINSILEKMEMVILDLEEPILKVSVSDSENEKKVVQKKGNPELTKEETEYRTALIDLSANSLGGPKEKKMMSAEKSKKHEKSSDFSKKNSSLFFSHYQQQKASKEEQTNAVWDIGDRTYSQSDVITIRPIINGRNQFICLSKKIANDIEESYPEHSDALKRLMHDIPCVGVKRQNGLHLSGTNYVELSSHGKKLATLETNVNVKYIADNFEVRVWCVMLYSKCNKKVLYFPVFIADHNTVGRTFKIDLNELQDLYSFKEKTQIFGMTLKKVEDI